jgi:hypothetical protein
MLTVSSSRSHGFLLPAAAGLLFALAVLQGPDAWAGEERIAIDLAKLAESSSAPTWRVDQGSQVILAISADEASELHLHGYDLRVDAGPGNPGEIRFQADVAGRFPLTRHGGEGGHGHDTPVGYLEIYPN